MADEIRLTASKSVSKTRRSWSLSSDTHQSRRKQEISSQIFILWIFKALIITDRRKGNRRKQNREISEAFEFYLFGFICENNFAEIKSLFDRAGQDLLFSLHARMICVHKVSIFGWLNYTTPIVVFAWRLLAIRTANVGVRKIDQMLGFEITNAVIEARIS